MYQATPRATALEARLSLYTRSVRLARVEIHQSEQRADRLVRYVLDMRVMLYDGYTLGPRRRSWERS